MNLSFRELRGLRCDMLSLFYDQRAALLFGHCGYYHVCLHPFSHHLSKVDHVIFVLGFDIFILIECLLVVARDACTRLIHLIIGTNYTRLRNRNRHVVPLRSGTEAHLTEDELGPRPPQAASRWQSAHHSGTPLPTCPIGRPICQTINRCPLMENDHVWLALHYTLTGTFGPVNCPPLTAPNLVPGGLVIPKFGLSA